MVRPSLASIVRPLLPLLAGAPALAGTLAGVTLPDQAVVGGKTLVLNGLGLREATVFMVDVYVAGLYVPAKTGNAETILYEGTPKRIVLKFVRSVGREKLTEAWTEGFAKNERAGSAGVADGLAALNGAIADVKRDDTIVATYVPDAGTTIEIGGKEAATIPGPEFARVFFSIWLGASPPNAGLKEGLLGRLPGR